MKKLLAILFNAIVIIGFSAPTDTISPLMPPRPPQNPNLKEAYRVDFYDLLDKTMLSELNPASKIYVSSLPHGVYIVKFITDHDCYMENSSKYNSNQTL